MDQEKLARQRLLRVVTITAVCLTALGLLLMGYTLNWTGFRERTLWDWLKLVLAVAVTAMVAYFGQTITRQQYLGQQEAEENRAQAEALEAYLAQIGQLLLDDKRPLRKSGEGDEGRILARAWTLTVLQRLKSGLLKRDVVQFLYEADLITKDHVVVDLMGVHLAKSNLTEANLKGANLRGAYLVRANLMSAKLSEADLGDTKLLGANLVSAELDDANLRGAVLIGDGSGPPLPRVSTTHSPPILHGPGPQNADLRYADLRGADLTDAYVSEEQLLSADFLQGAIMPNGQKYEDWLKSKGHGEDRENTGPS